MRMNIGRLPAREIGIEGLVTKEVLLQLVEVKADETPVGDGAAELGMLDGLLEAGLVRFEERLAALLRQEDTLGFVASAEGSGLECTAVDKAEDDAIHYYGLEDLCHVQVQRVAPPVGGVKESYARVEVGAVDLAKNSGVHEAVAEGDERIDPILRRPAGAPLEPEVVAFEDRVPRLVVKLTVTTFECHQFLGCSRIVDELPLQREAIGGLGEIGAPASVVSKDFLHVCQGALDEKAGEDHALFVVYVVLSLPQRKVSGDVLLTGHVRAGPVAIVIVDVQGDVILAQEV